MWSGLFTGLMFLSILVTDYHYLVEGHHEEVCHETGDGHLHDIPEAHDCLLCHFTATWIDHVTLSVPEGPFFIATPVLPLRPHQWQTGIAGPPPSLRGPPEGLPLA